MHGPRHCSIKTKVCKEFSKPGKIFGVLFAIVLGGFAAREIHANSAYLPSVGPPPLRFQMVSMLNPLLAAKLFPPLFPPKTNSVANTNTAEEEVAMKPINNQAVSNTNLIAPANTNVATAATNATVLPMAMTDTNIPLQPLGSILSPSSASDLLTVTPQMLIEYLKPVQAGTNQTEGVVAPAAVQFVPPTPAVPAESRAIYKSQ